MMMFTKALVMRRVAGGSLNGPLCTGVAGGLASAFHFREGPTMAISMHSASVPIFVRMLGNLVTWLDKAEAHASAKKFETSVYLSARLAPDMLPLTQQIQIASDAAKFCIARLAGAEAPPFADDEKTLADLRQRIQKT